MNQLEQFIKKYPLQSKNLGAKSIEYRHHRHEDSEHCLVMLTGGLGLVDMYAPHFEAFSEAVSVISVDYQPQFANQAEFVDAVAALLKQLNTKAWIFGPATGGMVAQILAKEHPQVIEGLVLANSASLAKERSQSEEAAMQELVGKMQAGVSMLKLMPFPLLKAQMRKAMEMRGQDLPSEKRQQMESLLALLEQRLNKESILHIVNMILDLKNHRNLEKSDFFFCEGRVLLLFSNEDQLFGAEMRESLTQLFSNPQVCEHFKGGQLSLLMQKEELVKTVLDFILP